MQVAKSIIMKVSKKINRDKFLSLRNFFDTYQTIARLYYSYILENSLEEKLISEEITAKDLKNILHQKLYKQIRETFDISSQTTQEIRDVVVEVFNSYTQLLKKERRTTLPKVEEFTIRLNYPRVISVFEQGKEFDFFFKLKVNGDKRVAIPVECGEIQKQLLKDALNGKYKIGAFQLVKRDDWFYFVIPIKKEVEIKQEHDGIVGVDLGLRYNAVITLLYKNGKITHADFVKYRKLMHKIRILWHRIDELKSVLPKAQKTSKRIQRLWRKIRRINDWIAHNVSRRIVEIAKENDATIAMENLKRLYPVKGKNSRRNNRRISNWIRGRVVKYTIYKARWEGIRVRLVPAKNTSKTCHLCGSQGLRTGATFFCKHCHHQYNSDFNASVNIALRATPPESFGCVNQLLGLMTYKAPCESWE